MRMYLLMMLRLDRTYIDVSIYRCLRKVVVIDVLDRWFNGSVDI